MTYKNSGAAVEVQDRQKKLPAAVKDRPIVSSNVKVTVTGEGWNAVVINESPSSGFWLVTGDELGAIEVGPETSRMLAEAENDIAAGRTTPGRNFRKKR